MVAHHTYLHIYTHTMCVCVLRMRILDPHVCWLCADDQGWFFDGEVWWYCCLGPMSHQKTKLFKCCLICSEELFGVLTVCWLFHRVFFLFLFDKQIFLVHSQPGFVRWKTVFRLESPCQDWNRPLWTMNICGKTHEDIPSGKLTVCYGKWPIYRWFTY